MPAKNFDEYIDSAQEFAKPILFHLRDLVHDTVPGLGEVMKWNMPNFVTNANRTVCFMAAFKQHASFGFWEASKMNDVYGVLIPQTSESGMGSFGKLRSLNDLPKDSILREYIIQAYELALTPKAKTPKPAADRAAKPITLPADFKAALKLNQTADSVYNGMSPSHQREYLLWISEAKREETRARRIAQAIVWLSEGKRRDWKYVKK